MADSFDAYDPVPQKRGLGGLISYFVAIAVAALGVAVCLYVAALYQTPAAASSLMCGDGGNACARVFRSPAGSLLGVPIPLWGAGWFAAVGLFLAAAGPNFAAQLLLLIAAVLSALYSAFLMLQLLLLQAFCGYCIAVHALNFGLLVALVVHFRHTRPLPQGRHVPIVAALFAAGVPLMFLLGALAGAAGPTQQLKQTQQQFQNLRVSEPVQQALYNAAQPVDLPLAADVAAHGPMDAPARIVAFKDFQCPYCSEVADRLEQLRQRYGDLLRIEFRHYPLDRTCNPYASSSLHPDACLAAKAAEAARLLGGNDAFWRMHDLLFEHRKILFRGRPLMLELAEQAGLDAAAFAAQLDSAEVSANIALDVKLHQAIRAPGVPAVFFNGRWVDAGWYTPGFLEKLIDQALRDRGIEPPATQPTTPRAGAITQPAQP